MIVSLTPLYNFPLLIWKFDFKIIFSDHSKGTWTGTARIPLDYFPPGVTKFNAYSIHGTEPNRVYEALFPVPGPFPDFHRLEHFQPIDFKRLRRDNDLADFSELWKSALKKEEENLEWNCETRKYFVCTFSWKENKYYTIPKCQIQGFMLKHALNEIRPRLVRTYLRSYLR